MDNMLFEACQEGSTAMKCRMLGLFLLSVVVGCQGKAGEPGGILKLNSNAYVFFKEQVYHDQADVARAGGKVHDRSGESLSLASGTLLRILDRDPDGAKVLIEEAFIPLPNEKLQYVPYRKSSLRGEIGWLLASDLKQGQFVPASEVANLPPPDLPPP